MDRGGYAQAAEHLHRSQSSVSYAITKLQEQLGVRLLYLDGRKARLTEAGEALLRRSRQLVQEATALEGLAHSLEQGWEPEIRLVVDAAFPTAALMQALREFGPRSRGTRVGLREVVLSGADDALLAGEADLAIAARVPDGLLGDTLAEVQFVAVAHPGSPLLRLGRELTAQDLQRDTQVVTRDSGRQGRDAGWLGAGHRWTVTSLDTALSAVLHGLGYAWLPRHKIEPYLRQGSLRPLPLREGGSFRASLYLVYGDPRRLGPGTRLLAEILRRQAAPDPKDEAPAGAGKTAAKGR